MRTITETVELQNPTGNPDIEQVLNIIGREVLHVTEEYGEGDVEERYEFPEGCINDADDWIACMGDDALGTVTGAFNDGDDLILQAHYGDEGIFEYSMLNVQGQERRSGKYNYRPEIYLIRNLL